MYLKIVTRKSAEFGMSRKQKNYFTQYIVEKSEISNEDFTFRSTHKKIRILPFKIYVYIKDKKKIVFNAPFTYCSK